MKPEYIGIIGVIMGVTIQWGLDQATKSINSRKKANCNLRAIAFVCLDRLNKIRYAKNHRLKTQLDNEIHYLGADLDSYLGCIAQGSGNRKDHWDIYQKIKLQILQQHNLKSLEKIIRELETIAGVKE